MEALMNRAEQIRERIEQIEAELRADPIEPFTKDRVMTPEWLDWALKAMPSERHNDLVEERRGLAREYERLPASLKQTDDA
jgi:uncharacterized protein YqcC (DUF446 family)